MALAIPKCDDGVRKCEYLDERSIPVITSNRAIADQRIKKKDAF